MVRSFPISEQGLAGALLVSSWFIFMVAGTLFTIRVIWKWPAGRAPAFYLWERGFVISALLTASLGLTLLQRVLETAGDGVLGLMGLVLFLIAAVLAVVGETVSLGSRNIVYSPIVAFVILAFLGQAFYGAALLRTNLLPAWIAWATILWNLAWLVILPIKRPQDIYYPWLHYAAPLLIGIALLIKR